MILQIAVEVGLGSSLIARPEAAIARAAEPDPPEAPGSKDLRNVNVPHVRLDLVGQLRNNLESDFVQDHLRPPVKLLCEPHHITDPNAPISIGQLAELVVVGDRNQEGMPWPMARTSLASPELRHAVLPLNGSPQDYDPLLEMIGEARVVLLGEASHGTREFYAERALITQRLLKEMNFSAVAVEADWPDAYRINRWVRGVGDDQNAIETLADFQRFPRWMWRNQEVLRFVEWLHGHNSQRASGERVGFYGLDLYSLSASMEAVIGFLEQVDPDAATRARYRYSCFEDFGEDSQAYGYAAEFGLTQSCEDNAVEQLLELQRHAGRLAALDGTIPQDEFFYAEQNARLVKNAEEYYRTMFRGRISSWNLRDRHMAETLEALLAHLERQRGRSRVVVWEHNSHVGDARATGMGAGGEWNIGQLSRERFGHDAVLVGFTTFAGTVTAASDWGAPAERKRVRPGLLGSWEALFHELGQREFLLPLRGREIEGLERDRLQRAIGVIYRPDSERVSHYFDAHLPSQFDAVIHLDHTRAVEPLDRTPGWDTGEPPETYPTGL